MENKLDKTEEKIQRRIEKLQKLEEEIKKKENHIKNLEKTKKQVPLRLSSSLWEDIAKWAEEDFRSINGQIEYLLSECVKRRKRL